MTVVKIAVFGSHRIGKSNFISKLVYDVINDEYLPGAFEDYSSLFINNYQLDFYEHGDKRSNVAFDLALGLYKESAKELDNYKFNIPVIKQQVDEVSIDKILDSLVIWTSVF
jgi:GTPase SAR1 family protein